MSGKNPSRAAIALIAAVTGSIAAAAWAATEPPAGSAPRNDADYTCKLDGKINSIGAVLKDEGKLYRCTAVFVERGIPKAAWVQVEMTTSIVMK